MSLGSSTAYHVLTLINEHGSTATLVHPASRAYNPATGQNGVDGETSETNETIKVAFVNYNEEQIGSDVLRGDRKALISADGVTSIDTKDKITGIGDPVNIVSVQTIQQNDKLVAYICQVRG